LFFQKYVAICEFISIFFSIRELSFLFFHTAKRPFGNPKGFYFLRYSLRKQKKPESVKKIPTIFIFIYISFFSCHISLS